MRRQSNNNVPSSPSWKSIRIRSSSLPRIRVSSRRMSPSNSPNSGNNARPMHPFNDNVRSWAKLSWLSSGSSALSPPAALSAVGLYSPTKADPDNNFDLVEERRRSSSSSPRKRTPVLTLALLRLEEQIPAFCENLADPTANNVHSAMSLIDSTVATASPSNQGSPSGFALSPSSPRSASHSPARSPIRSWLTGSVSSGSGSPTNMNSIKTSAMALESEWERFVLPLFLLAGAEFIYSSFGHSHDATAAQNLCHLYQKIEKEINLVREVLCDPLLASEVTNFAPNLALYYERASSLSKSLHALAAMTQIRSQMIQFHFKMWQEVQRPDFEQEAMLYHELLPNLPRNAAHSMPIIQELEKEVQSWKYLMKTTAALEQCRFADTILSAQKMKGRLRSSSKTCIQVYLRNTLRHLMSISPIIFDRIQAFSKALYGFQNINPQSLPPGNFRLGSSQDLESEVLGFLRRQEKGGLSMAVSVVLDAVSSKSKKIERGFALYDNNVTNNSSGNEQSDLDSALIQWPAVYMRTTMHHGLQASNSSHSLLDGMRRNASRSHMDKSSYSHEGSAGMLRPRSNDSTSQIVKRGKSELNVLEYAPEESGESCPSWPHASWKSLVAIITGTGEEANDPAAVDGGTIDRPTLVESMSLRNLELDLKSLSLPSWSGVPGLDGSFREKLLEGASSNRRLYRSSDPTTFRISALSDYMWVVVMIRPLEESRWHRRRASKVAEDDIGDFLASFSGRLRMADLFKVSRAHEVSKETIKQSSLGNDLFAEIKKEERIWNDDDVQTFLQSLKEGFRLRRPMSSLSVPLGASSYRIGFRSSTHGTKSPLFGRRVGSAHVVSSPSFPDMQTSAAAFFLGPDLMHSISVD